MLIKNKKLSGFTIVELLIVIVVIGILAAITIVAYQGVQTRAQNASTISIASNWQKLFEAHYNVHGSIELQTFPNTQYVCLGDESQFPAVDSFPAGACIATGIGPTASTNQELMTLLKSIGNINGKTSYPGVAGFRGVLYDTSNNTLVYIIRNTADCGIATATANTGGPDGATMCAVSLSDTLTRSNDDLPT